MTGQPLGRSFSFERPPQPQLQPRQPQQPQSSYSPSYSPDRSLDSPQPRPPPDAARRNLPLPLPPSDEDDDDDVGPPPTPPAHRVHPGAHPSSSFHQLQSGRLHGVRSRTSSEDAAELYRQTSTSQQTTPRPLPAYSSDSRTPPTSRTRRSLRLSAQPGDGGRYWGRELGYSNSTRTASSATPGQDNMGEGSAGGGIAGIAMGVAATNERESGVNAMRSIDGDGRRPSPGRSAVSDPDRDGFSPYHPPSYSSTMHLHGAAGPPGVMGSDPRDSDISLAPYPAHMSDADRGPYADNPYNRYSTTWDPRVAQPSVGGIDPDEIDDDGDDGLGPHEHKRRSMLSLGQSSQGMLPATSGAAAGGAAAGGTFGAFRGFFGPKATEAGAARDGGGGDGGGGGGGGGQYGPVPGAVYSAPGSSEEKSEWLSSQRSGSKRLRWIVGIGLALLILGAIAGAVVGGVLGSRKAKANLPAGSSSAGPAGTAAEDDGRGDLTKDSAEIKRLMGNANLHKVFPAMDYTPWGTQYPECLKWPPSQNNVTRDLAVLSQLTNQVRLYGTDCNQTDMVLHSLDVLGLKDQMKVWIGVWQDKNATSNARQLAELNRLLDEHGGAPFAGVVIGNEVLFRKDMTEPALAKVIDGVKANLTAKKIKLPVATSDLGDNWSQELAGEVDVVMANVHPFFAGVKAEVAAGWTYNFWQTRDVALTAGLANKPKHIISEVGWPSGGGNNCGEVNCTSATQGSIAGIAQMNTFMDDFVCQGLANGTDYFWFSAFDEPWKVRFNEPGKEWEDKWGLMDPGRKLKPGLKIPDCGGKTVR